MTDGDAARFVGSIPEIYERRMGPAIFADYAADIARRAALGTPARVLETAAGTGIVTRALRNALPAGAELTATDLNGSLLGEAEATASGARVIAIDEPEGTVVRDEFYRQLKGKTPAQVRASSSAPPP